MEHRPVTAAAREYPAWIVLVPIVLLFATILLNPMPLWGGYADDFRYLTGAQCLDCLPTNHWERRFAIIWPTGIAIKLFGQNSWSVMIAPMIAGIVSLILTFKLVEHRYGRTSALIAACVLALTPVFIDRSMRISIDVIELAFLLGSVFILQRRHGHFWAGAVLALAVLCRPTMLAAVPMVAFLAWWQDRQRLGWFALGFLVPIAVEALVYLIAAGDPLYPWKLSLNHMDTWRAAMDSSRYKDFVSPAVDTTKSPLFNLELIDGWQPIAGFDTHWTIQGLANLFLNIESGITLSAAVAISLVAAKHVDRLQLVLIFCAAFFFGALTFGFSVDPRPRMFFPVIVIAAVLVGSLAPRLWRWPTKIVGWTFIVLLPLTAAINVSNRSDYSEDAARADALLAAHPYQVTENAKQRLALVRTSFPAGGRDLLEIDRRCQPLLKGLWLTRRDHNVCIYTEFPWPFEPYRNGKQEHGRLLFWMPREPNYC